MKMLLFLAGFIAVCVGFGFVRAILDFYAPESDADDGYTIRRGG